MGIRASSTSPLPFRALAIVAASFPLPPFRKGGLGGIWSLALAMLCAGTAYAAALDIERTTNPDSGLTGIKAVGEGFSLELVPLSRDYVKAMYMARGLPTEVVEGVASYCVFGSIARNTSGRMVGYRVAEWRTRTADGRSGPVKTKSEWVAEWRDLGLGFMWTLLPDAQDFAPGDWNQGFTTIGLPPGTRFDLNYTWTIDGQPRAGVIDGLQCAPETLSNE